MQIREIEKYDIEDVVSIHKMAFENFFLTSLGSQFLSVYYDSVRKDTEGLMLGCFSENELIGFCAACLYSKKFNPKLIRRNFFRFSKIGLCLLVTKPMSLIRLFNNFTKNDSNKHDRGDYSELLSVAVNPSNQGQGVGKDLLLALEESLKARSCSRLSLTTDCFDNQKPVQFYTELGYNIMYEFIAYPNRKMYRMIKIL